MMEFTVTINIPDEVFKRIGVHIAKELMVREPQQVQTSTFEQLLTVVEAMELLGIKSRVGFQSWCLRNEVFGKPAGKRKLFLQSEIINALKSTSKTKKP